MLYGYARVSTREQNEERQILELKKIGISEECIYLDKMSGKNFDRPQYKKLI
ncbi:MAG: recombinase family protein [Oribacterium sp.]|nr:recombinase family protein [Oribacterium sp.]